MKTSRLILVNLLIAVVALSGCLEPEEEGICEYGGEWYDVGDHFDDLDGCNTCNCMADGSVGCTTMGCSDGCYYGDEYYNVGDSFPADDGCNTCGCGPDGSVGCTEMGCES